MAQEFSRDNGGASFRFSTRPEERNRLWKARHEAYYAALATRPGSKGWATDVCVPISTLTEAILAAKRDLDASSISGTVVGHVGDGNFHMLYLIDPAEPGELDEARRLNDLQVLRALEVGGTCTGEHGIGLGKTKYLLSEHGAGVAVMQALKQALDRLGIMNPGKIFGDRV